MFFKRKPLDFLRLLVRPRHVHRYRYEMNKAYVRRTDGSDTFDFSFEYKNAGLNIERQFNFSRRLSENVEAFLGRVATNVDKIFAKKQKKLNKNKTETVQLPTATDRVGLYCDGIQVEGTITCDELLLRANGCLLSLKVLDAEYEILINTPWIKNAVLPSSILANFPVYPSKFETMFTDKKLSQFVWFKSTDRNKWTRLGEGFLYVPTNDDIDHYLRIDCVPHNERGSGAVTEIVSKGKVEADPGRCPFETRHEFTRNKLQDKRT